MVGCAGLGDICLVVAIVAVGLAEATRGKKNSTRCRSLNITSVVKPLQRSLPRSRKSSAVYLEPLQGSGGRHWIHHDAWNGTGGDRAEDRYGPSLPSISRQAWVDRANFESDDLPSEMRHPDLRRQMLQHLRIDQEKREKSSRGGFSGLLEVFLNDVESTFPSLIDEDGDAPGGPEECRKDANEERIGCTSGCRCAWYASCYPKFEPGYKEDEFVDGVNRVARRRSNIGVCGMSLSMLVLCSVSIVVALTLVIFYVRAWLLDWYADIAAMEVEARMMRLTVEKIDSTVSSESSISQFEHLSANARLHDDGQASMNHMLLRDDTLPPIAEDKDDKQVADSDRTGADGAKK